MPDLASLMSQLSGSNQQPLSDPGAAVLQLARASLDALVLRLGQTIDARVVGELATGLTQLSAAGESFVLKLEAPPPAGTAVTIRVTPTPQGTPAVTITVPATPAQAPPLSVPTPTAPLVQANAPQPLAAVQPLAQAAPAGQAAPQPGAVPIQPAPQPAAPFAQAAAPATPQPSALPPAPTAVATQVVAAQPAATPVTPQSPPVTVTAQPPTQVTLPVTTPLSQPVVVSQPAEPQAPVAGPRAAAAAAQAPASPAAVPPPLPGSATASPPAATSVATPTPTEVAPVTAAASAARPAPVLVPASPYPVHSSLPVAKQMPLPATPKPVAPPLNLADPAQAAARQDSAAPLLAKLAMLVAASAPSVPRPVLEAAYKMLANRIDLNRAAPDGKALEAAVLKSGVVTTPTNREAPADSKTALLALRSSLLAFLGGNGAAPVEPLARPAPPIKGEPPRAPAPQLARADPAADAPEIARTLLGHADAALSRLKLLQAASQPAEARMDAPVPRSELRVEIPMLLGAQTGILQLMVERDGRNRRDQERQRGWRMRFAMNFSETGEVGADISLLGRAASIAIWAADPETADALNEMLPELAPAIQRHGLELTSLRVRRGAPNATRSAPGRLLDSAR